MSDSFVISNLHRYSNPGVVWIAWFFELIAILLIALKAFGIIDSLVGSLVFLAFGILLLYSVVSSHPRSGAEIQVEIRNDGIAYSLDGETTVYRKELIRGARRGLFGCGWITLDSGHNLLVPLDSLNQIECFLSDSASETKHISS
jgi:hypothetical protein